jgi:hypothetical protein
VTIYALVCGACVILYAIIRYVYEKIRYVYVEIRYVYDKIRYLCSYYCRGICLQSPWYMFLIVTVYVSLNYHAFVIMHCSIYFIEMYYYVNIEMYYYVHVKTVLNGDGVNIMLIWVLLLVSSDRSINSFRRSH